MVPLSPAVKDFINKNIFTHFQFQNYNVNTKLLSTHKQRAHRSSISKQEEQEDAKNEKKNQFCPQFKFIFNEGKLFHLILAQRLDQLIHEIDFKGITRRKKKLFLSYLINQHSRGGKKKFIKK